MPPPAPLFDARRAWTALRAATLAVTFTGLAAAQPATTSSPVATSSPAAVEACGDCPRGGGVLALGLYGMHARASADVASSSATGSGVAAVLFADFARGQTIGRLGAVLGGGLSSAGGDGVVLVDLEYGLLLELGDPLRTSHGPFARVGLGTFHVKNGVMQAAANEVPTVSVGYFAAADSLAIDVRARGGLTVLERVALHDDDKGDVGRDGRLSPHWGAGATVVVAPAALDVVWSRIQIPGGEGRPLDRVSAAVCIGIRQIFVAVCGDGHYWRFDGAPEGQPTARVVTGMLYSGVTVGFGGVAASAATPGR